MNGEGQRILCSIAQFAFLVINRLLSRDQLLARELRSPETGSRQIYREECITVEMAAELRERFPHYVEIILFTPPEEKRSGADWYWRFQRSDGSIHARVQAKRVQRTEFGQSDDRGHIDLDGSQLARLLEAPQQSRQLVGLQAWLATYARFDATPPCGQNELARCPLHGHDGACGRETPSLWIADASEFDKKSQQVPIRQVIGKSLRLDCVLPCIGRQRGNGPEAKGFTLQQGLPTFRECVTAIESDVALRSEFEGALWIHE